MWFAFFLLAGLMFYVPAVAVVLVVGHLVDHAVRCARRPTATA